MPLTVEAAAIARQVPRNAVPIVPMSDTHSPTVLVVEDEEPLASLYRSWLEADYHVRVANGGDEALERFDDAVDVVLLDRRMPGPSGDDVLDELRSEPADARIALVTAVRPDFDVVEMGIDDYVRKPLRRADLHHTVERLLRVADYDAELREYYALVAKRAVLDAEKPRREREKSEAYARLDARIDAARERLDDVLVDLDPAGYDVLFRDLSAFDPGPRATS